MRLKDKVCIVTGAAGTLGRASARRMAAEGARLVLADLDGEGLGRVLDGIEGTAAPVIVTADTATADGNRAIAAAALDGFGRIDVFFGNAGIEGVARPYDQYPGDVYDRVMAVNVRGLFEGLQAIGPKMGAGGSIILTSSIVGLAGARLNIAYTASKHAVVGLMRAAAIELGPRGIRVNTIHPGLVDSPMLRRLFSQHPDPADIERRQVALVKLGRLVQPEDIANAVAFLASDDSAMVNSHTLVVDGGMIQ